MRFYRLMWSLMCAGLVVAGALHLAVLSITGTWTILTAVGVVALFVELTHTAPRNWAGRAMQRQSQAACEVTALVLAVVGGAAVWVLLRGSPAALAVAAVVNCSAPLTLRRFRRWMVQPVDAEVTRLDKFVASLMYTCPEYSLYAREPWCVPVAEPGATWADPAPTASPVRSQAQLLRQWRRSGDALQRAENAAVAALIVEERQRTLEELAEKGTGAVSWRLATSSSSKRLLPFLDTNAEGTHSR